MTVVVIKHLIQQKIFLSLEMQIVKIVNVHIIDT